MFLDELVSDWSATRPVETLDYRRHLDEDLPISVRAASQTGQSLRLRQGATIKTRDAILGTIIESANDAAVVLA